MKPSAFLVFEETIGRDEVTGVSEAADGAVACGGATGPVPHPALA